MPRAPRAEDTKTIIPHSPGDASGQVVVKAALAGCCVKEYPARMRPGSTRHMSSKRRGGWDASGVIVEDTAAEGTVDLAKIFGNARPVELEIGTGKGAFLLARAAARAELNFLGLEWARAYCLYAADRIRRAGLQNARMLCTEAGHFFKVCLPDASLWRIHIYFPDPWPKRRHHRRRLIKPGFVADLCRVLRPGGELLVITDHLDYFEQIRRVLSLAKGLAYVPFPRMADRGGELVGTNFERKYILQGRQFYKLAYMRYLCAAGP